MPRRAFLRSFLPALLAFLSLLAVPRRVQACACGCGVFNLGVQGMATKPGPRAWVQYSLLNQYQDWHGNHAVPASLNSDKQILTSFYNLNFQYMLNREWGIYSMIPVWDRYFSTDQNFGASPADIVSTSHQNLSDVRVMGMYTGLSADMSTALMAGLKLPTGPYGPSVTLLDRDTQMGTGTSDLLLGAYHFGTWKRWLWYAQGFWRYALDYAEGYRPGNGLSTAVGVGYTGLSRNLTPLFQVADILRSRDMGPNADPSDTGYDDVYVDPGFSANLTRHWQVYGYFGIAIYRYVNGYQLTAPIAPTMSVVYNF